MSQVPPAVRPRRRRVALAGLLGGVAASAALALTMNGTLAAFTAQITNSANNAATGSLVMQEVGGAGTSAATCNSSDATPSTNNINTNAATCSTINKYGGSIVMYPGSSSTQTVTIRNTGTVTANTFTLKPGTCTTTANGGVNGSAADLCPKLNIVVTQTIGGTTTTVTPASSTATSLAGTTLNVGSGTAPATSLAPGVTASFTFTVTVDSSADNTFQGKQASQPLVWNFSS